MTVQQVSIYALSDPRGGGVRYVGKANDPAKRLKSHLRDARRRRTPVYLWINRLLKAGVVPAITVLETCGVDEWPDAERRLIAKYRANGDLLNLADGGDEPVCPLSVRQANGSKVLRILRGEIPAKESKLPFAEAKRQAMIEHYTWSARFWESRDVGRRDSALRKLAAMGFASAAA